MKKHSVFFYTVCVLLFCWAHTVYGNDEDTEPCRCEWSGWMKTPLNPDEDSLDLSYTTLRSKGYKFCEVPSKIFCKNLAYNDDTLGFGVKCSLKEGLTCPYFCDEYEIKVECCHTCLKTNAATTGSTEQTTHVQTIKTTKAAPIPKDKRKTTTPSSNSKNFSSTLLVVASVCIYLILL